MLAHIMAKGVFLPYEMAPWSNMHERGDKKPNFPFLS
jgi:hypothetical protein